MGLSFDHPALVKGKTASERVSLEQGGQVKKALRRNGLRFT